MILKANEKPQLSILIPSIPSRFNKVIALYNHIESLTEGMNVEILILTDNKRRSIGEKHNSLKNICNGKYFMFIHDDDSLVEIKDVYQATFEDVDVITFKQNCLNTDGSTFTVTFGLGNDIEHNTKDGRYLDCKRPPFPVCAWHEKFKEIEYPDISYSEDGVWSIEANKFASTEIHISKIVHSYDFSLEGTEAPTESNEYWTNPNEGHS